MTLSQGVDVLFFFQIPLKKVQDVYIYIYKEKWGKIKFT